MFLSKYIQARVAQLVRACCVHVGSVWGNLFDPCPVLFFFYNFIITHKWTLSRRQRSLVTEKNPTLSSGQMSVQPQDGCQFILRMLFRGSWVNTGTIFRAGSHP